MRSINRLFTKLLTDGQRNLQMDSPDALRRSHCCERRLDEDEMSCLGSSSCCACLAVSPAHALTVSYSNPVLSVAVSGGKPWRIL